MIIFCDPSACCLQLTSWYTAESCDAGEPGQNSPCLNSCGCDQRSFSLPAQASWTIQGFYLSTDTYYPKDTRRICKVRGTDDRVVEGLGSALGDGAFRTAEGRVPAMNAYAKRPVFLRL